MLSHWFCLSFLFSHVQINTLKHPNTHIFLFGGFLEHPQHGGFLPLFLIDWTKGKA